MGGWQRGSMGQKCLQYKPDALDSIAGTPAVRTERTQAVASSPPTPSNKETLSRKEGRRDRRGEELHSQPPTLKSPRYLSIRF